jgi:hypothetical protein
MCARRPWKEDEPPRPSSDFNLSEEERALLADPGWVTEDDADTIISLRREKHDGKPIPFEEVLKRSGFRIHNGRVVPIR